MEEGQVLLSQLHRGGNYSSEKLVAYHIKQD